MPSEPTTRVRAELACWMILFGVCFALLFGLAFGCKGPDAAARVLSTFEVTYTDGSSSYGGAHSGTLDAAYGSDSGYSGTSSGDSDFHAWSFGIQPLAALHDPSTRTVEATDRLYSLFVAMRDEQKREKEECDARMKKAMDEAVRLPFVEHAPEPVATGPAPASGGDPAGSATGSASIDLPWWADTAFITALAGALGLLVATVIKHWPNKKASA